MTRAQIAGMAVAVAMTSALPARAQEPLAQSVPPNVRGVDEKEDAWLHERCSYRGLFAATDALVSRAGSIAVLAGPAGTPSPTVKIFRCAEKPPFVTTFEPAPPAAATCKEEPKETNLCVPPIAPPAAAYRPMTTSSASVQANTAVTTAGVAIVRHAERARVIFPGVQLPPSRPASPLVTEPTVRIHAKGRPPPLAPPKPPTTRRRG